MEKYESLNIISKLSKEERLKLLKGETIIKCMNVKIDSRLDDIWDKAEHNFKQLKEDVNMTTKFKEAIEFEIFYNEVFGKKTEYIMISDMFLNRKDFNDRFTEIIKIENRDKVADVILNRVYQRLGSNLILIKGLPTRFQNQEGYELGFYDYTNGITIV